jgi:hypothetical protein
MLVLNILAIIGYIVTSQLILRRHKQYMILFGFLYLSQAWALISCFYNELGTYNVELFRFTYMTLSTSRLALLYIAFNIGFMVAASFLQKTPLAKVEFKLTLKSLHLGNLMTAVYVGVALLFAYLGYWLVVGGIPVLAGFGRFEYFQTTDPIQRAMIIFGNLIAFVLGFFRPDRKKLTANGLVLALFIIYAILIGNKFSMLMSLTVYYYVAIYARYYRDHPNVRLIKVKHGVMVLIAVAALSCFAFFTYALVIGDTGIAYNYLINRTLAFQGEVWWAVDRDVSEQGMYDRSHGQVELDNILHSGSVPQEDVGMKYIMVKILGADKAYPIIERGYLYTMAYPAILITIFSYWSSLIIQILAGAFFALLLFYLNFCILYRHAVRAIITMVVIIPFITVLFTGNFAVFFTFGMFILVALELGSSGARRKEVSA